MRILRNAVVAGVMAVSTLAVAAPAMATDQSVHGEMCTCGSVTVYPTTFGVVSNGTTVKLSLSNKTAGTTYFSLVSAKNGVKFSQTVGYTSTSTQNLATSVLRSTRFQLTGRMTPKTTLDNGWVGHIYY